MNSRTASNALTLTDRDIVAPGSPVNVVNVAIWPSSPETGLAVISSGGPVLLTTADVVALRDFLNLALEQSGAHPFTVIAETCQEG